MKKLIALLLAMIMIFNFAACSMDIEGSSNTDVPKSTSQSASATEPNKADEKSEPVVDVDKNLFTVELTIPVEYIGEDVTQASLDTSVSEGDFKSATLNADGSVTYVMSKDQHKAMMDEMKASLDASLAEYIGSAETPTITAIETNDDYTEFKVTLSTDTLGFGEAFSALGFMLCGAMYNVFNGTEVDNIAIYYIDQATGQVIHTTNSSELGEVFDEETEPATEPATEPKNDASNMTMGQKNALKSAKSYLSFSAFSYSGLIEQLEYEKYSREDAVFAVDNCGADWFEQALKSAKSYLAFSAFSYTGLIEQLEYEGFTKEQATYAADNCNADWNEQAAKSAKSYLSFSSFSRGSLIDQLEYEGFTHEQAVYGVTANGY